MKNENVFLLDDQVTILNNLILFSNQCPDLIEKITLDDSENQEESMYIGTLKGGTKKANVIGGYNAELPFAIYLKMRIDSSVEKIERLKEFEKLSNYYKEAYKENRLPYLTDRDVCLDVRFESNPYLEDTQEMSTELYRCDCVLIYRHKSKYEN